MLTVTLDAF